MFQKLLEQPFGTWQLLQPLMVTTGGLFDTLGKPLEGGFNFMMFVVTFDRYLDVGSSSIGKGLEKVRKQLSWHITDLFTLELRLPD